MDKVSKSISKKRPSFGKPVKQSQMPMFDTQDIENISLTNNRFNGKQSYNAVAETKSEFQFPINNQRNKVNVDWDQKSR